MWDKIKEITREIDRLLKDKTITSQDLIKDSKSYKGCEITYKVFVLLCIKYNKTVYDILMYCEKEEALCNITEKYEEEHKQLLSTIEE